MHPDSNDTREDAGATAGLPLEPVRLSPEFFGAPPAIRRREIARLARRRTDGARGMDAIRGTFDAGDPEVIPALTLVVEHDPDVAAQRSALFGLSRMPDPTAIPGLLLGLGSRDRASRAHAVNGLGKLRAREAVPHLIGLLDDGYLQIAAADALVAIRDERAREPLKLAAGTARPWRRRALRRRATELEQGAGSASC
jgi:hypothetical protein